jgi:hypothetical protein
MYVKNSVRLFIRKKSLRDAVGQTVLINVYYAKFESVLKYDIFFWGGVQRDFKNLLKLQKKWVMVIKGEKNRVSYRNLFRELKILTGTSLFFFIKHMISIIYDLYYPVL